MIAKQRESFGPMSARDLPANDQWPGLPEEIRSREDFKKWIDGYDTAIRHVDDHVGLLMDTLEKQGILEETMIIISADHGENQGELNIYGDHQTADYITSRIPCIIAGAQIKKGHVDDDFHYQIDLGPTLTELVGGEQREKWDGESFLPVLTEGVSSGRPYVVVSQAAWSCQRAVRFEQWMLIRSYHHGLKDFSDIMLFDVKNDPHETTDVAEKYPEIVGEGMKLLEEWVSTQMLESDSSTDPMWHVIHEGGPFHTRGELKRYLRKLRSEGRHKAAEKLAQSYS